jgi:hypothetical protein
MRCCSDYAALFKTLCLETGVLVGPLPIWENEWKHPEQFNNPALIENIQREGVYLYP